MKNDVHSTTQLATTQSDEPVENVGAHFLQFCVGTLPDQVDAETRGKLINLEKRLRLVFKEVDEIDKDVEGLARLDRLKNK